jgi:hypothetical protein
MLPKTEPSTIKAQGPPGISKGVQEEKVRYVVPKGEYNRSNQCVKRHNIQSESHGGNQMGICMGNEEINSLENNQMVVMLKVKTANGSDQW